LDEVWSIQEYEILRK